MTWSKRSIKVLPGVPGMDGLTVDDERTPYPESTLDFVKTVRLLGLSVEFAEPREDRRYVGFKAYEIWLPILEVARDLLLGIEGGLLVELLKNYLAPDQSDGESREAGPPDDSSEMESPPLQVREAPSPSTLLHVDWRVLDGDRESRFRANGDAESVLQALTKFEKRLRDDQ